MGYVDNEGNFIRTENSQAKIRELENKIRSLENQIYYSRDDKDIVKISDIASVIIVICGIIGLIITFMGHWFFGLLMVIGAIFWLLLRYSAEVRDWFIDITDL